MAARLSPLNLALLLVTACALTFGVWGVLQSGANSPRPVASSASEVWQPELPEAAPAQAGGDPRRLTGAQPSLEASGLQGTGQRTNLQPRIDVPVYASSPSDSGDARIEGSVLFANGRPAADVTVTCRRTDLDLNPPALRDGDMELYRREVTEYLARSNAETRRSVTDENGRFAFTGLDPRLAYNLHAQALDGGRGVIERVAAGDSVRILLSGAGILHGRVIGPDGGPITDFTIRAWPEGRQWEARTQRFNSPDGTFSLPGSGRLLVEASADGFAMESPLEIDVRSGGEDAVLHLEAGATLTGTVSDGNGEPLSGVLITVGTHAAVDQRWNWGRANTDSRLFTDSKGRYRVESLKPGQTIVTATLGEMTSSEAVSITVGSNTLDLRLNVGATVAIRLTAPDGTPLEPDSVWFQSGPREWPRPRRLNSREPGLVEYAGLRPGEYTIMVAARGYPTISHKLDLPDGRTELDLRASSGAVLRGRVTTRTGSNLLNASVRLRSEQEQGTWGAGRSARVGEDGRYRVGPIEPGSWILELYVQNRGQPLHTSRLNLTADDNVHDIQVDTGATLVVMVTDMHGSPAVRATVHVQGEQSHRGTTDSRGVATIAFLNPGSHAVYATVAGQASHVANVNLAYGENRQELRLQQPTGARITHVYPNTQAATAGIQVGDMILEYHGQRISSWTEFSAQAREARNEAEVTMVVERNGAPLTFRLRGGTVGIEGTDAVR